MSTTHEKINGFLQEWPESNEGNKKAFARFYAYLKSREEGSVEFHPRPGVTYSLRGMAAKEDQKLYVMVDVIEDEPRWLSVCFYGAMITDPEEKGAFVPGGLLGEDAVCFDLYQWQDAEVAYIEKRIQEAYSSSCR